MIYEIRTDNDPILLTPTEEFNFDNPQIDPIELANNLLETMREVGGVGIAANQCGLPLRVFIMASESGILACFNPRLRVHADAEPISHEEGCLSYPDLFMKVVRPGLVEIDFQDERGNARYMLLTALDARIAQHECDHLDGVSFTSRVSKLKRDMAMKKRSKARD